MDMSEFIMLRQVPDPQLESLILKHEFLAEFIRHHGRNLPAFAKIMLRTAFKRTYQTAGNYSFAEFSESYPLSITGGVRKSSMERLRVTDDGWWKKFEMFMYGMGYNIAGKVRYLIRD
jgi:hypothetical protein